MYPLNFLRVQKYSLFRDIQTNGSKDRRKNFQRFFWFNSLIWCTNSEDLKVSVNQKDFEVEIHSSGIDLNGLTADFSYEQLSDYLYLIIYNNKSYEVLIEPESQKDTVVFHLKGKSIPVEIKDDLQLMLDKMGLSSTSSSTNEPLKAPMPGLILDILVKPGAEVDKGEPLLILEAMKMENVIKASTNCIIDQIKVSKADSVEKNQALITFKS